MTYQELALGQGPLKLRPWGLALLLLPDPVGLWGLSFSWMTGCGFGTLVILSGDGDTGVGSAGCGSLGGMAAALGFSVVFVDWMILEISYLGAIVTAASACLVGTCGPGMAASLIWIQFLFKTPLGVLTT